MFRERIPARQLSAWLAAGMIPVLVQLLAGAGWAWIVIAGAGSAVAVWAVWRYGAREYPGWLSILRILYIIVALGHLLEKAGGSWPAGHQTVVPVILLALAAWSAQKGPSAAARTGGVLFWFVIIMYLAVFGAGARDVKPQWLKPELGPFNCLGFVVLLLPCAAAPLLGNKEKWGARLTVPAVFALTAAVITAGILSPWLAGECEDPFYELSRSLNLLGIAKRFEAVISAGMTVGWFLLMSLLLSVCGCAFENVYQDRGKIGVWLTAGMGGGWLLCGLHIPEWILAAGAAVFWVLIPILTQEIGIRKKSKKSKKGG